MTTTLGSKDTSSEDSSTQARYQRLMAERAGERRAAKLLLAWGVVLIVASFALWLLFAMSVFLADEAARATGTRPPLPMRDLSPGAFWCGMALIGLASLAKTRAVLREGQIERLRSDGC